MWLGTLWSNRGAGFGLQRVAFWSSPQPSPRACKRGSMELLASSSLSARLFAGSSSLASHLFASLPVLLLVCDCQNVLLLLREPDLRSFEAPRRAADVPPPLCSQTDQCRVHVATRHGKVINQEITHHIMRWESSGGASHRGTRCTSRLLHS